MDKNATLRSFFTQSSTKQSQNDNILSIKLRDTLFGLPDNCRNKVFLYHCVKSVFPLISTFATRGLPKAFQHKYPNNTSSKSLIPDTKTQLELELNILTPSKEMYYGFCYLIMWLLFPCKLRCADSIRGKSEGAWLIVFVSLTLWLLTLVLTRNSFSFPWSHSLTDIFPFSPSQLGSLSLGATTLLMRKQALEGELCFWVAKIETKVCDDENESRRDCRRTILVEALKCLACR